MIRVEYFDCNNVPCDISFSHIVERIFLEILIEGICDIYFPCTVYNVQKIVQIPQWIQTLFVATLAINFANIYMFFPSRVDATDVTARKECFEPFFSSSFKPFRGLPRFVSKGILTCYFSTNFLMTSAFLCGPFGKSLSAWDRLLFVHCWMSCLDLKNIDQLLALQLLCFLCFLVCVIFRWSNTARISLDFPFLWHAITFYKWHLFSSFVHFPYFCTTYIFPHWKIHYIHFCLDDLKW